MALTVDEIKVLISAETAPYRKAMEQVKSQTDAVSSVVSKFKGLIAGLAIGAGLFKLGQHSTQMALEVSASINQIKRIMGESTQAFLKWSEGGALAFNMAKSDALKYGAVYSNLFSNFIKDTEQLSGYTVKMLEASAVVASATGQSMDDVMNRIRSGMLGSTEAIEDLGINVNVSMIEATNAFKQFANGQSWSQLDFNTQQAIRMMAILEQASAKYGDTVMQGPVSSLAYFTALLKDSALNIGNALLPVMQAIMPALSAFGQVLKTVTGYFATFMQLLFGKTAEASGGVSELSNSMGGVSNGLSEAAGNAGDLDDAVGGVGNSAKKAKKELLGLMGFDEINTLGGRNNDDSGSSGGSKRGRGSKANGGGVSGGIQLPKVSFSNAFSEQDNGPVLAFLEKFKALIQPTIDALGRLQEALKPLGQFVYQGLVDFYQSFLMPVGKWVLGEGLPRFIDMIANTLNNIDFPKINSALKELFSALAGLSIAWMDSWLWFLEEILSPLTSWTISNVVPVFLKGLAEIIEILTSVHQGFEPYRKVLFDGFLKPIASWTGGVIIRVLEGIVGALTAFSDWCRDNKDLIGAVAVVVGSFIAAWGIVSATGVILGIVSSVSSFVGILTNLISAVGVGQTVFTLLAPVIAAVNWPLVLITGAIGALIAVGVLLWQNWETVMDVAGKVWQWICDFIGSVCKVIGDFFVGLWNGLVATFQNTGQWFTDMFKSAWDGITGVFNVAVGWFGGIWNGITNVFSGVSNFFGGIFQGAWNTITGIFSAIPNWFSTVFSAAWAGVRDIFSTGGLIFAGIVDGIAGTFKNVVNAIIGGINGVVSVPFNAINGALDGIRGVNIMGFAPFTWLPRIGVPRIPMLARGGIVDSPTLAMIGEAGTEAVVPLENTGFLETMGRVVGSAVVNALTNSTHGQSNVPHGDIVVRIGDKEFGRFAISAINKVQRDAGEILLNI